MNYLIGGLIGFTIGLLAYHIFGYYSLYSFKYEKETKYILKLERENARLRLEKDS